MFNLALCFYEQATHVSALVSLLFAEFHDGATAYFIKRQRAGSFRCVRGFKQKKKMQRKDILYVRGGSGGDAGRLPRDFLFFFFSSFVIQNLY